MEPTDAEQGQEQLQSGEESGRVYTPEVSMWVRGISQVRVSPDGLRAVYVIREAVMTDEKSEYVTQIYLANSDGGETYPLTFGEKSSSDPQWSPDGKYIAFLSKRGETKSSATPSEGKNHNKPGDATKDKNNLFLLRTTGGEAERLTEVKADIAAFAWSPDSVRLVFAMSDPPTEEEEKRNKGKDDWTWVEEDVKMTRLHVVTAQKDADGRREIRVLTPAILNVWVPGGFDWSADSKSVAFTHTKSPSWNDWITGDISVVDVQSGDVRALVMGSAAASQPRYAPDGRHIAFALSDDPPHWAGYSRVHVIPAEGGEARPLAPTFDGNPGLLGWSEDGDKVYCAESRGTQIALYALDAEGEEIQTFDVGQGLIADITLNATRTHIGFTRQSSTQAVEAFVTSLESLPTLGGTQISQTNGEFGGLPIGETETIRWRSQDGMEVEGLLTYPAGYQAGQRVPLLLVIHGGPAGVFLQNFIGAPSIYPLATFTARGYALLRVNPRGSSGYGKDFRYANRNDWGGGDYEDLMTGVDSVIDRGVADPARMGVMGWSYGGFMTSWIITHTDRFKCASVGAAVTNLMSFTGTADIPGFLPDYFGGQFWDDLEPYRLHSPMFHVKGASTPSLIQHGDADLRVPISQGYELYNALKAQGVPVRMLVLPRQPHGPSEPKMQLKTLQTNADWFDAYLKAK